MRIESACHSLATRRDLSGAVREELEVATGEDFFMARGRGAWEGWSASRMPRFESSVQQLRDGIRRSRYLIVKSMAL